MKTLLLSGAAIAALASATPSAAQVAMHTLEWLEVHANSSTPVANPNGLLEPGEAALLRVSVSFEPLVGSQLQYPGGVGTVAAFGGSYFHWHSLGNVQGTWSNYSAAPGFELFPDPTFILGASQPTPSHPALPNAANPVQALWEVVWTPSDYTPRQVSHWISGISGTGGGQWLTSMILETGIDPTTGHPIYDRHSFPPTMGDAIQIPIIPAPGAATIMCMALAAGCRRGRRLRG